MFLFSKFKHHQEESNLSKLKSQIGCFFSSYLRTIFKVQGSWNTSRKRYDEWESYLNPLLIWILHVALQSADFYGAEVILAYDSRYLKLCWVFLLVWGFWTWNINQRNTVCMHHKACALNLCSMLRIQFYDFGLFLFLRSIFKPDLPFSFFF